MAKPLLMSVAMGQKVRAEESKGGPGATGVPPPVHTASSGRGGHSLTFTLQTTAGESSGEWEFPAKQAGKVQYYRLLSMAKKSCVLKSASENCWL